MLLATVKGLLREETGTTCKMRFVLISGFQSSMLFLVPIALDNRDLDSLKLSFLSTIWLLSVRNHN